MTPEQKLAMDKASSFADMHSLSLDVWERLTRALLEHGEVVAQLEREAIAAFLRRHNLEQIAQAIEIQSHKSQ